MGTVSCRFYRWRAGGIWQRIFATLQEQGNAAGLIDWDTHYVDGTVVRAHQHAAGGTGGPRKQRDSAVAVAVSPQSFTFVRTGAPAC
jgi:hypothetical protein